MIFVVFLFGLIIGSFLNVAILRYHTGRGLSGRSLCFSCGKKLCWYELIPLASFICQKGRCRGCGSKISWQYPIVELATGLLFALVYWRVEGDILMSAFYWLVACLLIFIVAYDWRHQIIPDQCAYLFILLGLIKVLSLDGNLWGLAGAFVTALPLFLLWAVSRGKWLGFGDVKLALGIGLMLGIVGGLSALVLAFMIGALIGVGLIVWGKTRLSRRAKSYTMKSEIPFAPFLVLGFWLVFIFSINVFSLW